MQIEINIVAVFGESHFLEWHEEIKKIYARFTKGHGAKVSYNLKTFEFPLSYLFDEAISAKRRENKLIIWTSDKEQLKDNQLKITEQLVDWARSLYDLATNKIESHPYFVNIEVTTKLPFEGKWTTVTIEEPVNNA